MKARPWDVEPGDRIVGPPASMEHSHHGPNGRVVTHCHQHGNADHTHTHMYPHADRWTYVRHDPPAK